MLHDPACTNALLHGLRPIWPEGLQQALEFTELPAKLMLERRGRPCTHAYFPASGIASLVARERDELTLEVGLVGREGMIGVGLILGDAPSLTDAVVLVPGVGWRIEAEAFRAAMVDAGFHARMLLYLRTTMAQITHNALANARCRLDLRLARWLLMCHDRISGNEIALTHGAIALLLGVRRAGVTVGLHELEGHGLIRSTRGRIEIRDRAGLRRMVGDLYGGPEAEYRRLLGRPVTACRSGGADGGGIAPG